MKPMAFALRKPHHWEICNMDISNIGPRRRLRARQQLLQDLRFKNFTVQQLSPTIGAELHGIDLGQTLSESAVAEIKQALVAFPRPRRCRQSMR